MSGKGGQCLTQNILYQVECLHCQEEGKKAKYIGESGRTAYDRGQNHLQALEAKDDSNPLVAHWLENHQGQDWKFNMSVLKVFDTPLQRQANEGFQIANFKGDVLLNRKGEWGNNLPPKLVIDDSQETSGTSNIKVKEVNRKTRNPPGGAETAPTKTKVRIGQDQVNVSVGKIPNKSEATESQDQSQGSQ